MVFSYFFKSLFSFLFFNNKANQLVWHDLLNKFSYRYANEDKYRYRIFITFYSTALRKLFSSKNQAPKNSTNILLLDLSLVAEKERRAYTSYLMKDQKFDFLAKEFLPNTFNFLQKLVIFLFLQLVFITSIILSFFYKNKANLALLSLEFVELSLLNKIITDNKYSKIIFFSAYEKDTCFITNFLICYHQIHVQLVPSPNPINNFYLRVICTTFSYTVAYQKTEYEKLKDNWIVQGFVNWPPAGFTEILETINRDTKKNTIGYISSGNWLRKQLGHNDTGKGYFEAEENLVNLLKKYTAKHKEVQLIISLHPLERKNEKHLQMSKKYYNNLFGTSYKFFPFDNKTREFPELFDVGISAYSSATFERFFAGYKAVFSQKGMKENYFFDPRLSKITANEYVDFEKLLDNLLVITNEEFFKNYGLTEYRNSLDN